MFLRRAERNRFAENITADFTDYAEIIRNWIPAFAGMTQKMIISGYRAVWIFAMFDLPTDTDKARKDYTHFRKNLLKDGFAMIQYSVYARHCASEENADVHYRRIQIFLPPDGEVRLVTITDKQFEKMRIFWGKMRKPTPEAPKQLELF